MQTRAAELYSWVYVGVVQGYIVQSSIFIHFDADTYLDAIAALEPTFARTPTAPHPTG